MNRQITYLFLALLALVTHSARAADLNFDGAPSFSVAKSKITMTAPKLINQSATGTSGLLRLQTLATTEPYGGGEVNGFVIGTSRSLRGIPAGGQELNVSNTVAFKAPPNGNYYTAMTVEEWNGSAWVVRNYYNFPGQRTFSTDAQLQIDGPASWRVTGNTLRMNVAKISNFATSGRSGPLRLETWATAAPYTGGPLVDDENGYLIGATTLGPLAGGFAHENVKRTARYFAPPDGFFFTTLVVRELTGDGWVLRDFEALPGAAYFGESSAQATKLDLQGPVSWNLVGRNAQMRAAKIVNNRVGSVSGPLKLQLWASTTAYNGGTFDGFVLASAKAGKIAGGTEMHNITKVGALNLPPTGEYFTTIALVEETPTGDVVQDFVPLGSTITLDRKTLGGLSGGGTAGTGTGIEMTGRTAYKVHGTNEVNIVVGKITNHRQDVTGPLRLGLYALAEPYVEGPVNGTKIAERPLGRLAFGSAYNNISGLVPYNKPAAGTYYVLLTVEELQGANYVVVDTVAFARPVTFR